MSDDEENSSKFPIPATDGNEKKVVARERWKKVEKEVKNQPKKQEQQEQQPESENETDNEKTNRWSDIYRLISSTPSNAKTFLGVEKEGKSLVNWDERALRVMRGNRIFGGKIKEKAVEDYLRKLNGYKLIDQTDPFSVYNATGNAPSTQKQNTSVANIVYSKAINMIGKKEEDQNMQLKALRRSPTEEFEGHVEEGDVGVDNVEGPIDACCPKSNFRRFGVNFCDRLCDNYVESKSKYDDLFNAVQQHRPYFTYWVTFVQIVICIVSLCAYGISPIGFSYSSVKGLATTINLEKQLISYQVKQNFWIGPAVADLIHLGAKYAPCMRNDSNIYKAIQTDRELERESACCIRNDRGGCVQTNKQECSTLLSNWHRWNKTFGEYGSVCGLDPKFCDDEEAKSWSNDITLWPICEKPSTMVPRKPENAHMTCEIIGRPCCVGVQGECIITTREHCDLRKGYFHDSAHLCSQVDCMQGICGMIEFLNNKSPDQVYRLFTSIFIHAGIIQLIITILFQFFILRDIEKLSGCVRVSIIYIGSGILGNLASAIFLPYQAEVGPSGAHLGTIACLYIEMFLARDIYEKPCLAFLKTLPIILLLFAIGFLPMIDNYANIFGFIAGLLLSAIVFPNVKGDKCNRIVTIIVSTILFVCFTATLIVFFYIKPIDKCDYCKFLSCPFSSDFCLNMDFNITRIRNTKV